MIEDIVIGKIYSEEKLSNIVAKNPDVRLISNESFNGFSWGVEKFKVINIIEGFDMIYTPNGTNRIVNRIKNIIIEKVKEI